MTVFRTYKVVLGAFLLALYAFVATPVQYWHHHKIVHAAKQGHDKSGQQHQFFQDGDASQQDANCPVCSHKYSTYSEISIVAFEPCNEVTGVTYASYQGSSVTGPSFPLPNKGPPAVFI